MSHFKTNIKLLLLYYSSHIYRIRDPHKLANKLLSSDNCHLFSSHICHE